MAATDEVTVAVFRTQAAAEMARQALDAAGLPARTEQGLPAGRVALKVSEPDAEEAREILAAGGGPVSGGTPDGPRPRT